MIFVNNVFCEDSLTPNLHPEMVTFFPYAMCSGGRHAALDEVVLFVHTAEAPQSQLNWLTCVADLHAYCANADGTVNEALTRTFNMARHYLDAGAHRLGLYFCEDGVWSAIHRLAADESYQHAAHLRRCAEHLPAA